MLFDHDVQGLAPAFARLALLHYDLLGMAGHASVIGRIDARRGEKLAEFAFTAAVVRLFGLRRAIGGHRRCTLGVQIGDHVGTVLRHFQPGKAIGRHF